MINFKNIFYRLWNEPENEVVEFKEAKTNFDIDDLGKYYSALSNEANLRGMDFAWLIFGVSDKKREIVGTTFKDSDKALNRLKNDMAQNTTGNHIFREIHPIDVNGKRVLIFQVPASPRNIVMCWRGIAYARNGESLKPLDQGKQDEIRNQSPIKDWSAEIVPNATIKDLDELALAKARIEYAKVHRERIPKEEIDSWSLEEFLGKCNLMRDGKLVRAAILLLGKPMSEQKLFPAVAQITWCLNDNGGNPIDYEHFTVPYLLTVDHVLAKIRNLTMWELPEGTLFPDIMQQYDSYTMREALHNCIAHMDYRMEERITIVENPGTLVYANGGSFVPGTVEDVLNTHGPQRYYRNKCLCIAMVNFNMIDTIGRGIKKMYTNQRERSFPMPDYDIDNERREVKVTIYGRVIDEKYTQLLKEDTSLSLKECILLDAVQKHHRIPAEALRMLREKGLVEGRVPNVTISLKVAQATNQLPQYHKMKGLEKNRLIQMIEQFVGSAKDGATRNEIFQYVSLVLPSGKSPSQKLRILSHVLEEMSTAEKITNVKRHWFLTKK
ncbi:MAG: putative DNA binding domain-containing protein [Bacteroidales bacterium]|nr:putative DNA binding domain-containing protein [Bacteroidales bacterium]